MRLKKWWGLFGALLIFSAAALADVEINTANVADLDGVKGIGPALSGRILAARKNAPFKDWADFMRRVSGVQEKKAAQLSEAGLRVNAKGFRQAVSPVARPAASTAAGETQPR